MGSPWALPGVWRGSWVGLGQLEHLPPPESSRTPFLPVLAKATGTARAEARPELRQEQGKGCQAQNPLGGSPAGPDPLGE